MNAPVPMPYDTTVITYEHVDYGEGPTDRVVFASCKFQTHDGTLNVFLADDADKVGNVATFAPGSWASAIRGRIVALADVAPPTGQHQLKAVQS